MNYRAEKSFCKAKLNRTQAVSGRTVKRQHEKLLTTNLLTGWY